MNQPLQGIFLAVTLILGVTAFPLIAQNTVYAVEVDVNAGVNVNVGSNNDTAKIDSKTNATAKMESKSKMESKTKIEVYVYAEKSTIKIESNGEEKSFVIGSTSKADIIAKIQSETNLSEDEITSIWEFEDESQSNVDAKTKAELDAKVEAKITAMTDASEKARARSKIMLESIKDKLQQTDHRAYSVMLKAKANGYLNSNSSIKSYIIALDGNATSKTKTNTSLEGNLYLDLLKSNSNVAKYTVSGGKIVIDGQNYDILFGKARETSLSNESKTHMILIAEVIKPDSDVTTMKILLESDSSVDNQTGSSWMILSPQSHIAGTWKLDATGDMSLT